MIGTHSFYGSQEQLEYRELTRNCTQDQVIAYLETLALTCDPKKLTVMVLDNATFHKGKALKACKDGWEARGLFLRYLPAYCPFLNTIEGVWRKIKGFLMPRRCYNSVLELREALVVALKALGGLEL